MKSKPNLASINIEDGVKKSDMEEVIQSYKQAIVDFNEKEDDTLPDALEQFLLHIAKTGDILESWDKVQKVFILKMKKVLEEFYENQPYKAGKIHSNYENDPFEEMKERLVQLADKFESPPFTMQRLCELITTPQKNYTKCEKFMRALEKNLMVVTSWSYPSRRNSETAEQINGGFETRPSFNAVDRPWATLPHSPVATSAPAIPSLAEPSQEEATPSDEEISDDASKSNNVEMSESSDENTTKQNEKSDITVETMSVQSTEETTDEALPTENNESPGEATSVSEAASISQTTTTAESQLRMAGDTTSLLLTNTEKDALKEPLPGVGTLVEKHAANKPPTGGASAAFDVPPSNPKSVADETECPPPTPSPKRKATDDEVPMEVERPIAKRLRSDKDVPMVPTEEEEA